MKKGDLLKIKGRLGFLLNPKMIVLEIKNGLVLLKEKNSSKEGLLSHLNQTWHSIETIKRKL